MCTADSNPYDTFINIVTGVGTEVLNFNSDKKNYEYRTRLALNNAKIAQNEALRQQQLGIEQSRLEKISGIQEANKQKAISAASNLDVDSLTSQLNYDDNIFMSDYKADVIKKEYDARANSYLNQSNSYLNQAQDLQKQYNDSVFQNALNALGKTTKVSLDWYRKKDFSKDGGGF